ncbi:hypothetical protein [Litoribacillus peritrichatus]|uniref:Uncharacterized protein n=1 Tax=Litoribacillus peritrichatus TaxID=718191 RepID=A0ABP7N4C8_9GAMM
MSQNQCLEAYCANVVDAVMLLYSKNLFEQLLIVVYTSIDTLGLIHSDKIQTEADRETFKIWAEDYLSDTAAFEFTPDDLWLDRCKTLRAPESLIGQCNKARNIQFINESTQNIFIKAVMEATANDIGNQRVVVNIDDFVVYFLDAVLKFSKEYGKKVAAHEINIHHASKILSA